MFTNKFMTSSRAHPNYNKWFQVYPFNISHSIYQAFQSNFVINIFYIQ